MILFPLIISFCIGFLTVRLLTRNSLPILWQSALGLGIGLGLVGLLTFFQLLILNYRQPWLTITLSITLCGFLAFLNYQKKFKQAPVFSTKANWIISISLSALTIILFTQATNFPLGGWDAWSCWNLKAKFIYLSADNWRVMFAPELWRSNTHYPLLLPSIIAFGWQWIGSDSQSWPMLVAISFTIATSALIMTTLLINGIRLLVAVTLGLVILTSPLSVMLSISQYSDIVVAFFSLSAITCFLLRDKQRYFIVLAALSIGILSFSKSEGLVAAGLLTLLSLVLFKSCRKPIYFVTLLFAGCATVIFQLTMAPHNEAFINGFTSTTKPTNLERLQFILVYPWFEIINLKWQGLWIALAACLLFFIKQSFSRQLMLFWLFIVGYLAIVVGYYWINTFFEIAWWLNTTLHRILFALLPTIALWIGLSSQIPPRK